MSRPGRQASPCGRSGGSATSEVDRVGAVLGLARLDQGDGFYLVAWDGDDPPGHAHLALTDPPEMQDVAVRPEHRRRGVASALTAAAEDEAARARLQPAARCPSASTTTRRRPSTAVSTIATRRPARRVQGTIQIRTGPIEVDDTLLTWEKTLGRPGPGIRLKLVAIGIGSVIFGIELLRDVFRVPEFRGAELWLVDVDPDALARMTKLAERLNEAADWDVGHPRDARSRGPPCPDADFVVTSVAVDRVATWQADHALALSHGFASVLSENGGPGGLSHTLRSVPLMVEIGRDVEALAPGALILNYTNPENRVCLALHRHTSTRVIGLCHSVAEAIDECARTLGRPRAEIDVHAAGVNHFTWFLSIRDARDGSDLMPEFRRRTLAADPSRGAAQPTARRARGAPSGDRRRPRRRVPAMGSRGHRYQPATTSRGTIARSRTDVEMLEAWGSGDRPVEPLLAEPSNESKVDHSAAEIMGDVIARRTRRRPSFILPNDGYHRQPSRPIRSSRSRASSRTATREVCRSARCPSRSRPSSGTSSPIQDAAVEAAIEGSRDLALRALLLDPVVNSARAAEHFIDDVLRIHRACLPRFWT